MKQQILFALLQMFIAIPAIGQTQLFGINLEERYDETKNNGKIEKELVLKNKSVFYSVKITRFDFVFSTVHEGL